MQIKFNVDTKLDKEIVIKKAKNVLFRSMAKINELAKHFAPVDTGRLRASIHLFPLAKGETTYTVSDGVEYGIHQEYGTFNMQGTPFIRPAADEVRVIWGPIYWRNELL